MPNPHRPKTSPGLVTLIAIIIIIAALYAAQAVLLPLAVAILLTFLLAPLVIRLQHFGLNRVLSVLIVTVLSFVVIGILGWIVAGQLIDLAGQLPQYKDNIRAKVESLKIPSGGVLGRASKGIQEISDEVASAAATQVDETAATTRAVVPIQEKVVPAARPIPVEIAEKTPNPFESVAATITPLLGPLASAGIVMIFVFFMLIQREDLRDRIIGLIGEDQLTVTTTALDEAAERVSRYLLALLIVNASYGIAVGVGLHLIGLPNAVLWGVLAALVRFIPYVGPFIGGLLPIALSLAVSKDWTLPIMTAGLIVVIEVLSNNLMEPLLYGSRTGLTPIAVLLGAVFWAWLWGPIGLVLATPLTVCLVVIGRYVPRLEFLNLMLGDKPALPPEARVYQRLLAMDQDEVFQLADEYLKEKSLLEFYEHVLMPALGMAERDRHHGNLEEGREQFIYHGMRDLIENLGERQKQDALAASSSPEQTAQQPAVALPAACSNGVGLCVLTLPARDEADEIAGLMLTQLLRFEGIGADGLSVESLSAEMLDAIETRRPGVICVSAMPPLAVMHSRYLCKRLSTRFPDLKVVVALWTIKDLAKATERIRTCGTERVVSSLTQAIEQLCGSIPNDVN